VRSASAARGGNRHGVGTRIKQHQRTWCLDRGIPVITWTFDPLVRRNAVFNIARLGAVATAYLPDFYGAMEDVYNAGFPSDRLLVRWQLTDPPRPPLVEGVPVLDVDETGAPKRLADSDSPAIRLRVPARQPRERESRLCWLTALRETMAPRIAGGHRLTSVTDDGWYVLTKEAS
jgi:predicted GNAT superfamily acetyltransferase